MKLTKEEKAELVEKLAHPWGRVVLLCDGDEVALVVERAKGLKYCIVTYVNGFFRGAWMSPDKPAHEQRYLRKVERPFFSPAQRAKAEKQAGKRFVKKHFSGTYTIFEGTWPNGKAAIAHLCKVCESIKVQNPDGPIATKVLDTVED